MRVMVPGSFDPLHKGHIELLRAASELGEVYIVLKGDQRLTRKKGKVLMSADDRFEILKAITYVHDVIIYDTGPQKDHDDFMEIMVALEPDIWAIGDTEERCIEPEYLMKKAKRMGISVHYNVGGEKTHSSTQILENYHAN